MIKDNGFKDYDCFKTFSSKQLTLSESEHEYTIYSLATRNHRQI